MSFGSETSAAAGASRLVSVSQVVLECELVSRSEQLERALAEGQHAELCAMKAANSSLDGERRIWDFLKVQSSLPTSS